MSTDYGDHGCTDEFSGTSAAAPMVSGAIALALQAKYVQHHQINLRSISYHLNTKLNADNFRPVILFHDFLYYVFFSNFCSKELTWRDVQHLIAMSSDNKMKVKENDWIKNGAGFKGTT